MAGLKLAPSHIAPTIGLCLVPYAGLVAFLVASHAETEILHRPSVPWLLALVSIGALAPLWRTASILTLLVREKDHFHLGLLVQIYLSLVLIFASLYALLQVAHGEAFRGMLDVWGAGSAGTLGHHLVLLTSLFGEALYLSAMTITTVGFGDLVPTSFVARGLVIVEALTGIAFLGLVVGQYFSFCTHGSRPSHPS